MHNGCSIHPLFWLYSMLHIGIVYPLILETFAVNVIGSCGNSVVAPLLWSSYYPFSGVGFNATHCLVCVVDLPLFLYIYHFANMLQGNKPVGNHFPAEGHIVCLLLLFVVLLGCSCCLLGHWPFYSKELQNLLTRGGVRHSDLGRVHLNLNHLYSYLVRATAHVGVLIFCVVLHLNQFFQVLFPLGL